MCCRHLKEVELSSDLLMCSFPMSFILPTIPYLLGKLNRLLIMKWKRSLVSIYLLRQSCVSSSPYLCFIPFLFLGCKYLFPYYFWLMYLVLHYFYLFVL